MAERDVVDPLDRSLRASIARRLLDDAGFVPAAPDASLRAIDPSVLAMERPASRLRGAGRSDDRARGATP